MMLKNRILGASLALGLTCTGHTSDASIVFTVKCRIVQTCENDGLCETIPEQELTIVHGAVHGGETFTKLILATDDDPYTVTYLPKPGQMYWNAYPMGDDQFDGLMRTSNGFVWTQAWDTEGDFKSITRIIRCP